MEDPRIVEVAELQGQYTILTDNPVFVEIIRQEVKIKLGPSMKRSMTNSDSSIESQHNSPHNKISTKLLTPWCEPKYQHTNTNTLLNDQSTILKECVPDYSQILNYNGEEPAEHLRRQNLWVANVSDDDESDDSHNSFPII